MQVDSQITIQDNPYVKMLQDKGGDVKFDMNLQFAYSPHLKLPYCHIWIQPLKFFYFEDI